MRNLYAKKQRWTKTLLTLALPAAVALASLVPLASDAAAATDKASLARGRYLATSVVDCLHCHTKRDTDDFTKMEGPAWAGGEVFGDGWELPGVFVTPNLTPDRNTGLGAWTDAQVKNAIRNGVNRDGERLFPLMPSHFFQAMSDADLDGLVAYLRSLPPQKKPTAQQTKMTIPRSALPPLPPVTEPVPDPGADPLVRGKYLVTLANCITCHSPTKGGQEMSGRTLAGGVLFKTPFGQFSTPNITPDIATGVGAYTDQDFENLFRKGIKRTGAPLTRNFMPWWVYRNMTDKDLKAIITYLRSLPAVENDVHQAANQVPLGS